MNSKLTKLENPLYYIYEFESVLSSLTSAHDFKNKKKTKKLTQKKYLFDLYCNSYE